MKCGQVLWTTLFSSPYTTFFKNQPSGCRQLSCSQTVFLPWGYSPEEAPLAKKGWPPKSLGSGNWAGGQGLRCCGWLFPKLTIGSRPHSGTYISVFAGMASDRSCCVNGVENVSLLEMSKSHFSCVFGVFRSHSMKKWRLKVVQVSRPPYSWRT